MRRFVTRGRVVFLLFYTSHSWSSRGTDGCSEGSGKKRFEKKGNIYKNRRMLHETDGVFICLEEKKHLRWQPRDRARERYSRRRAGHILNSSRRPYAAIGTRPAIPCSRPGRARECLSPVRHYSVHSFARVDVSVLACARAEIFRVVQRYVTARRRVTSATFLDRRCDGGEHRSDRAQLSSSRCCTLRVRRRDDAYR